MKVLVVGGGGREHAIAWKLLHDDPSLTLFAAPGNPGIAELATCVPIPPSDIQGLCAWARESAIDVTIVGPEAPLAAGIVDVFRAARLPIFGPTRAAAEIETSKAFAKQLMREAGVPTARAVVCSTIDEARAAVAQMGAPVVIKASGLAAGKGVIVAPSLADAHAAIDHMLRARAFGDAGSTVLIEEFMEGEELSVFAVTDGQRVVPLLAARDHKRLLQGDAGPNTGGMGAYSPVTVSQPGGLGKDGGVVDTAIDTIILPTIAALRECGRPFTGLLYAGLMLTSDGPKVVEFNCRFGDPETQAILPIMSGSVPLLDLMLAVARGEPVGPATMRATAYAVTTVVAAEGYPERPRAGDPIQLPANESGTFVFHAGTARAQDGTLITAGGRVLAVTSTAPSLAEAQRRSVAYAERIAFTGKQFRSDIGWRELADRAGTT